MDVVASNKGFSIMAMKVTVIILIAVLIIGAICAVYSCIRISDEDFEDKEGKK